MDCEACQDHLAHVLGEGRPKKLLQAIRQGRLPRKSKSDTASWDGGRPGGAPLEKEAAETIKTQCEICPDTGPISGARAYLEAPPPGIVLCANRLSSRREVEEAVVHELVHAYDYLVAGVELQECQPLAYSEVRAAYAAECSAASSRSFLCSYFQKRCVRHTAAKSTEVIFPGKGAACVNAVFDEAYEDHGPCDESKVVR